MQIDSVQEGASLNIAVDGEVNSGNADEFAGALKIPEGIACINLDLAQVPYISSAGLRVLLMTEKSLKKSGGKMVISHVQPDVREIFDITGFSNILTVE